MPDGQRRLAAIVAMDVAGYSRLMGADEEGTIAALRAHRQAIIDPGLARYRGRVANTAGDSLLIEFPSAVDALRCAIGIQREIATGNETISEDRRLVFRVGINVGDVVSEGDDLLGDGVNVAARLEGLAEPGGICLSRAARDQVRDRTDVVLEDLGEVDVKNIARPVRVFRVSGLAEKQSATARSVLAPRTYAVAIVGLVLLVGGGLWWWQHQTDTRLSSVARVANPSPGKLSIAVMPFANISDDKGQAYFADGISEDITTDLAKVSGLYVAARSATLRFRNKAADPRVVAGALGVAHILEGSVRRAGDRIRIAATLIDATTGGQLWAERFDRSTNDLFAIQDEISERVVRQLSVTLKEGSLSRVIRAYTPKLEAYDLYIQGRSKRLPPTPGNLAAALVMFEKAMAIDPKFAGGFAGASFVHVLIYANTPVQSSFGSDHLDKAFALARRAVALDPTFGPAWGSLAEALFRKRQFREAIKAIQRAIKAAPNDSLMRANYGRYLGHMGQPREGIEQVKLAMRMSPDSLPMLYFLGANYRAAGDFKKAISALKEHRKRLGGRIVPAPTSQLIVAYMQAGHPDSARSEAAALLKAAPHFTSGLASRTHGYENEKDMKRFLNGLRDAGIPE